jgi:hypothetical protein
MQRIPARRLRIQTNRSIRLGSERLRVEHALVLEEVVNTRDRLATYGKAAFFAKHRLRIWRIELFDRHDSFKRQRR